MVEEVGIIVSVDGTWCIVEFGAAEACGACQSRCVTGDERRRRRLTVPTPDFDLQPGDRVVVALSARGTLFAAGVLYLGSLLALFTGAFVGLAAMRLVWPAAGDFGALSGAATAFALGLWAARKWDLIEALAAAPVISRRLMT